MSAVCVNFRDVARKFARIFKVCNTLLCGGYALLGSKLT